VDPVEGGVLGALERLTEKVARLNAQLGGEAERRLDVAPSLDDLRAELEYFRTVLSRLDASAVDIDLTNEPDARTLLQVERRDIARHVGYLEDLIGRREQAVLPTPAADETPAPLEAAEPEPEPQPEPQPEPETAPEPTMAPLELPWLTTAHERRFRPASIAAGIAVALVVVVLGALVLWPSHSPSRPPNRVARVPATSGVVLEPPRELTVQPKGPSACVAVPPAVMGGLLNATVTAEPGAGHACTYTNTAPATFDASAAYPPFVTQVLVDYVTPATSDRFAGERTNRGGTVDLTTNGVSAFSAPGGSWAIVLANNVMVTVQLVGYTRPESVPDLQAASVRIALALRSQLPV
jgi:hypothetical protein